MIFVWTFRFLPNYWRYTHITSILITVINARVRWQFEGGLSRTLTIPTRTTLSTSSVVYDAHVTSSRWYRVRVYILLLLPLLHEDPMVSWRECGGGGECAQPRVAAPRLLIFPSPRARARAFTFNDDIILSGISLSPAPRARGRVPNTRARVRDGGGFRRKWPPSQRHDDDVDEPAGTAQAEENEEFYEKRAPRARSFCVVVVVIPAACWR